MNEKVSAYFSPLGGNVLFLYFTAPLAVQREVWKGPHEHELAFTGSTHPLHSVCFGVYQQG